LSSVLSGFALFKTKRRNYNRQRKLTDKELGQVAKMSEIANYFNILEGMFEAAPQSVLQLYAFSQEINTGPIDLIFSSEILT